jgi:hypothetical protein
LRKAISEVFVGDPELPWSDVLDDIADETEMDDTTAGEGQP